MFRVATVEELRPESMDDETIVIAGGTFDCLCMGVAILRRPGEREQVIVEVAGLSGLRLSPGGGRADEQKKAT